MILYLLKKLSMKNIKNLVPSFEFEQKFPNLDVVGIDEAGRGPLAGPVVASCVFLRKNQYNDKNISLVNDSKKLSKKNDEDCFHRCIDRLSIYHTSISD